MLRCLVNRHERMTAVNTLIRETDGDDAYTYDKGFPRDIAQPLLERVIPDSAEEVRSLSRSDLYALAKEVVGHTDSVAADAPTVE